MKLAHYVFLALLILPFVFPKLLWWLAGALFLLAIGMFLLSGPAYIASLFVPRGPKR